MKKSLLKLFNAVQVTNKKDNQFNLSVLKRTIKNGYILNPSIVPNDELLDIIEKIIGISGEKANSSFHKSWSIVRDSNIEDLIIQQIIHYFTTYGLEYFGMYDEKFIYIPNETLELPEIKDDIPLIFIKAMTSEEVLNNILILGSKIALAKDTLNDIITVIKFNNYDNSFVEKLGNRELKSMLYDFYNIVPVDPTEYLRYIINKLTGETLLIKNKYLIDKIKLSNNKLLEELLQKAPNNLASIFFRFKPLFLAMRSTSENRKFVNSLRKKANKQHIPLQPDYMNNITSQIKHKELNINEFNNSYKKQGTF